ncbi:porin [Paraburkholderia sp. BR10937]|uniref:porin n=1 Tax=Paraburkholderia sp. BR10937 TaxID=3236994 RepID=UPI0034D16B85
MNKRAVVLVVLMHAPAFAFAQSTVTLYGIIDAGITYTNNQGGHSNVMLDTGILQGNRWGLRGVEDLGGGLKAVFVLENGFNLNNGTLGQGGLLFGRTAYVGLQSSVAGMLTLGRQYDFMYDFMVENSAPAQGSTAVGFHFLDADRMAGEQLNNAIKYVTPTMGGVTLGAFYAFSNEAGSFGGTAAAPRAVSFGAKFERGPLVISGAYTNIDGTSGSLVMSALKGQSLRTMGIGARYKFNVATVFGNATNSRVSNVTGGGNAVINNYEGGGAYDVTPFVRLAGSYTYTTYDGSRYHQFNTAAHYLFSKATDVYLAVNYQHTNNEATGAGMFLIATPGSFNNFSTTGNQVAVRVGLRHLF